MACRLAHCGSPHLCSLAFTKTPLLPHLGKVDRWYNLFTIVACLGIVTKIGEIHGKQMTTCYFAGLYTHAHDPPTDTYSVMLPLSQANE